MALLGAHASRVRGIRHAQHAGSARSQGRILCGLRVSRVLPVMSTSRAYQGLLERAPVSYYDTLPGSEGKLIERIADGEIVINIRASSRFSERVFSSSPRLRLISIWGTGTDNVDLAAAARH